MSEFSFFIGQLTAMSGAHRTTNRGSRLNKERAAHLRQLICDLIARQPGMGASAIAEEMAISRMTASSHLQELRRLGKVRRVPGVYSGWELAKNMGECRCG